jgi:hypothetical protein
MGKPEPYVLVPLDKLQFDDNAEVAGRLLGPPVGELVVEVTVANVAQRGEVAHLDGLGEHAQDVAGSVLIAEPRPQVRGGFARDAIAAALA